MRLYLTMFMMSCAVLAIAPMLPDIQTSHHYSVASLGVIGAASLLTGVVSDLLLGPQADKGFERPMLVASVVLAAVALVGSGAAGSVGVLTLWRGVSGIAFGMFLTASSAVVIRIEAQKMGENLARLQVAEFAGFVAGPFLGALLLAVFGASRGLEIAGLAMLIGVPLVIRVPILRTAPEDADEPAGAGESAAGGVMLGLLKERPVWVALVLSLAVTAPVGVYGAMWPKFLADLGASAWVIAASLAVATLPFLVVAPYAGRYLDRVGPMKGAVRGTWIIAVIIAAYGFVGSVPIIVALSLVESVGESLGSPGAAAAMARASGGHRAGAGQGLSRAVGFFGAGVVALIAGPVFQDWGARALFGGAGVLVAVLVIAAQLMARVWAPELSTPVPSEAPDQAVV